MKRNWDKLWIVFALVATTAYSGTQPNGLPPSVLTYSTAQKPVGPTCPFGILMSGQKAHEYSTRKGAWYFLNRDIWWDLYIAPQSGQDMPNGTEIIALDPDNATQTNEVGIFFCKLSQRWKI